MESFLLIFSIQFHVKQFQVIQESKVDLLININKDSNFNEKESILFLKNAILNYGDPRFRLKFCYVNHIIEFWENGICNIVSGIN